MAMYGHDCEQLVTTFVDSVQVECDELRCLAWVDVSEPGTRRKALVKPRPTRHSCDLERPVQQTCTSTASHAQVPINGCATDSNNLNSARVPLWIVGGVAGVAGIGILTAFFVGSYR